MVKTPPRFILAALALTVLTGCPRPSEPPPGTPTPLTPAPTPTATPVPTPPPITPPPTPYVPNKRLEVGKIFNGMQYRVKLETEHGSTATRERNDPESYTAEVTVKVKVPKPYTDLDELKRINDALPSILPGLPELLETAKVSPLFDELYQLKVTALQSNLMRLDSLLTRHNFYDCETLLELKDPKTKRHALLVQSDMDSDTDGSDSDRVPEVEGASSTFQPFTSYRWAKRTDTPSQFIAPREARIKQLQQELGTAGTTAARKEEVRKAIEKARMEIADLKEYSFLIANADPYIVLSGAMYYRSKPGPFKPKVGDYCVVIYGKTLYPAIIGDVGPMNVVGEASLRLGKEINPRTSGEMRATNDLKVTYLIFPGTADKFDVPDLAKWRAQCEKYLNELGGFSGELFTWVDTTKPKPPPATPVPAAPEPGTGTPAPGSTPPASPSTPAAAASGTPPASLPAPPTPPAATAKPTSTPKSAATPKSKATPKPA